MEENDVPLGDGDGTEVTTHPEDDDPQTLTGEIVPEEELQYDEDTDVDPDFVELSDED